MSKPETESRPRYEGRDHLLRQTMPCYWPEEEREAVVCLVWALHDSILDRHLTAEEHEGLPTNLQAASDDLRLVGDFLDGWCRESHDVNERPELAERLTAWAYKARALAADIAAESRRSFGS